MFRIFYKYLNTETSQAKRDIRDVKCADVIQKLFWLSHLFELEDLKDALRGHENSSTSDKVYYLDHSEQYINNNSYDNHTSSQRSKFYCLKFFIVSSYPSILDANKNPVTIEDKISEEDQVSLLSFEEVPLPSQPSTTHQANDVKVKLDFSSENLQRPQSKSIEVLKTDKQNNVTDSSICKVRI